MTRSIDGRYRGFPGASQVRADWEAKMNRATPELIERAKKGDEDAVRTLYLLYRDRVYGLCLRLTCNQAEADDLTQEAFLRAFRKLHTFRGDSAFFTWLYRLTKNLVLMRLRKKPRPEVSLEGITEHGRAIEAALDRTCWRDPTGTLAYRLDLKQAFEGLPEGYKRVLVFHDLQGYNHNEIAEMTGRSVGNSKSQLHKARERMRKLLRRARPAHAV